MKIARKRFHFDLLHLGPTPPKLTLHVGRHRYVVRTHSERTRAAARRDNPALAHVAPIHAHHITHYVDVNTRHLPQDRLCRLRVTHPHGDPRFRLPVLVAASFHVPAAHRHLHRVKKAAKFAPKHLTHPKLGAAPASTDDAPRVRIAAPTASTPATQPHPKLAPYAVAAVPLATDTDVAAGADHFLTPLSTAEYILFHHPQLGTCEPHTAALVMDDHINSPANQQALNDLVSAITTAAGPAGPATPYSGWAQIKQVTAPDGTPMTWGYALGSHKEGDAVEHYDLSPDVLAAMPAALKQPLKSASNDPALQNRKWSVTPGKTAVHQPEQTMASPAPATPAPEVSATAKPRLGASPLAAASAPAATAILPPAQYWALADLSGNHGLSVDDSSLSFQSDATDAGGYFQINATNTYLRTLAAYVQFLDEAGNVIHDPPGWVSKAPAGFSEWDTSSKKYLGTLTAVNNVMGIPVPTDSTHYAFVWPANATAARLMFGGLGTSNWDDDVCISGAILTSVFQFGIPLMFLAAATGIKSTKFYSDFIKNPDNVAAVAGVAFSLCGPGVSIAAVYGNTRKVLSTFGSMIGGFLAHAALARLMTYVCGEIAEDEAEDSIPIVGWVLRAIDVGLDGAQLAETTGELLSSPALLEYQVRRAFNVRVRLSPDPAHGMPGKPETAVWPAVSDHFVLTLQYLGGTNFVQKGTLPATTSNTPIDVTFTTVPAGGRIQITAGIYAANGWLCGKWTSDWLDAKPDNGFTLDVPPGTITELLVPLSSDTQYAYKEKIVYDDAQNKHVWQAGSPPVATIQNLDSSNAGQALSRLSSLTIFEKTFEIGYSWQAAPLGLPMGNDTTPTPGQACTFQNLSVLAAPDDYRKFPNRSFAVPTLIAYDQFGTTPSGTDNQPRQFFIDPRNGQFHLRALTIDDGPGTVDLTATLPSWGRFPLDQMDALVITNGHAIAASWIDHKLAILKLPAVASDDANAPDAVLASGEGTRQGLLGGPRALTVTPDGRLLVLETINQRIQAFDRSANPVPCFDGAKLFSLPAPSFAATVGVLALDKGTLPDTLAAAFQEHRVTWRLSCDAALVADLDQAIVSPALVAAFAAGGETLSVDAANPASSTAITVLTASQSWRVVCSGTNRSYNVALGATTGTLDVFAVLDSVKVDVRKTNWQWIITDLHRSLSYDVQFCPGSPGTFEVCEYLSYMPLYQPPGTVAPTYLDLASEGRGYLYVLSCTDQGKAATDYFLDIYEPNGAFLCRTPDPALTTKPQNVVAARLVVDTWRNAYTLNFESITGANGATEPSIGHWMPMPPLFSPDATTNIRFFNMPDIIGLATLFNDNAHPLADGFTVTTVSTAGHWKVRSGTTTYDVIRTGGSLNVYQLPASSTL